MSSLRILHVVPYYEQAWAYGGIPRLATAMTSGLARRGHHVTVCTTDACDESSRARPGAARQALGSLDVRTYRNISNRLAYHWQLFLPVGLRGDLRAIAESFDVAHLHACHNLPVSIAARALACARVPYIVSPNGTAPALERRVLAKRLFAATAGRALLRGATRVLAVTDAERRQLIAVGVPEQHIIVVPNPFDEQEFESPPDPSRFRALYSTGGCPLVMFLGKLTPRKGVDVLLRAFAQLRRADARLVIAGNYLGSRARLVRLARDLKVTDRMIWPGLLRGRDRLDALAAADVVIYPSRDEIFGLVPIETLLSGSPVIVCNDSGCGEIISGLGGGCIVPYGDVDALSSAVESILEAPALWRARARDAAVRARTRFAAAVVCERLEHVYRDVVECFGLRQRRTA